MKARNLITKIALGVGIAALLFSIVTLVRSIVNASGVLMAVIVLIGTATVVAICAIMLYVQKKYDAYDDEDGEDDDAEDTDGADEEEDARRIAPSESDGDNSSFTAGADDAKPASAEELIPAPDDRGAGFTPILPHDDPPARTASDGDRDIEAEVDRIIAELEKESSYDLHNFE